MNSNTLNRAYRILARRDHSVLEMKEKLSAKGEQEADIVEVIGHLKGLGYLDDALFAKKYVSNKALISPRGHYKLRAELKQKGVADGEIAQVLMMDEYNEERMACDFLDKKEKLLSSLGLEDKKKKLFQILRNRGFSLETIYKMLESC